MLTMISLFVIVVAVIGVLAWVHQVSILTEVQDDIDYLHAKLMDELDAIKAKIK